MGVLGSVRVLHLIRIWVYWFLNCPWFVAYFGQAFVIRALRSVQLYRVLCQEIIGVFDVICEFKQNIVQEFGDLIGVINKFHPPLEVD